MSIYKEGKVYRYEFQVKKVRYTRSGYKTKSEALAAREAHKKEVKQTSKTPTGMGLQEAMNEYLDFCKRRFSEKNYKEKVFIFRSFLLFIPDTPLDSLTARNILDYLQTRPSNQNWNKHRKSLCAFLQWAFKHGLITVNPCIHVDTMPENPTQKKIPSQEEMLKILLAAGEHRPFFLALYALTARLGEINRLRWEDVNFGKRIVTLWTRKGDGTYRAQPKPLNDELYDVLHGLYSKKSGEFVFPNPKTKLPFRNRRAQIRKVCASAGVPYYSWHCIRHHVASLLSDHFKVSLPTIQKMLGHANLSTTQIYVQSLGEGVRDAADLLQINKPHEPTTRETEGKS